MELRILGIHNFESRDTRMASYIIDDVLALDAGSLTRSTTFEQQKRIKAVILSHRHFDHTRDIWPLGMSMKKVGNTIDVFGIEDTINMVASTLLGPEFTKTDFTRVPSPEKPTYRYHVVEFYKEFQVLDYTVVAVPVPHAVPAAGYQVSSDDVKLFYTGDTGRGVREAWKHVAPRVLLTEVTFGNENEAGADEFGHLTPARLGEVLAAFEEEHHYLPRVIATHISPSYEETVRRGLKELSAELGIEIQVAEPDQTIRL